MKKLLLILFLLPLAVIGQSLNYDTTFADGAGSNWKASVHLPSDYYTTNKLYKLIMFIPGTGEIGGSYYTWNKVTGEFFCYPNASLTELFRIVPV